MALKTCLRRLSYALSILRVNSRPLINKRMCVTWFMVNEKPEVCGYKLVLAFNRDEYFNRPATQADFLKSNQDVLCGVDMTPGKEGGTWLGISKTGRLACLLNIREKVNPDLKGRGSLVTNFLASDVDGCSYLKQLNGSDFNGFNLITMDIRHAKPEICYYSNRSENGPLVLEPGFYGVSNSVLSDPWPKAQLGKEYLAKLLNDDPQIPAEELTEKLIEFASKKGSLFGNPSELSDEEKTKLLKEIIYIDSPVYGTRATTVILVDSDGKVTFTEKTIPDPMDSSRINNPSKTHVFKIDSST